MNSNRFPRSGYFYYPAIDDRNFLSNRNIVEYRDCARRAASRNGLPMTGRRPASPGIPPGEAAKSQFTPLTGRCNDA
jgi:hypothetical protein